MPIELLGYHLGLIVDKEHRHLFWRARTGKRPGAGYGTQINTKRYEINRVFKKLKIPITVSTRAISEFTRKEEIVAYIADSVRKDKNVIALLNSDVLNATKNNNGHACVIDRIYPQKRTIRVIDPLPAQAKWRELSIDRFVRAVRLHPTGQGRFLELKKV